MADLLIKQVRSTAGSSPRQRDTLRTLRLGRIGKSVTRSDDAHTRGLLRKVEHLISVETAGKAS
ncbi:MAG TPA: 50S ribosomal protein L30 [Thermomicrobiales bacterium]|jgi:large subunit ribosomal protein L30|nr:50S ribosomal protein L30 [Thermomicrobiales bacterium]